MADKRDRVGQSTVRPLSSGDLPVSSFAYTRREVKALESQGLTQVKPKKGTRKNPQKRGKGYDNLQIVHSFRTIMPDQCLVEMPWIVEGVLANAGIAYASLRFQTNGLYDPDPAVGGTSFTGLSQWGNLYIYYRCLRVQWELKYCNREAFSQALYVYHSNTDPTATVGAAGAYFSENAFGKSAVVGASGGMSVVRLRGSVDFAKLQGSKEIEVDDSFVGLIASSNPADLFWIGFNTDNFGTLGTATGGTYQLKLKVLTRLYDRKLLTS